MRYSKNAEFNGRCVRLVLLPDGTELLYINDRGEFNIEPVGAPSYAQALHMAKRRAQKEGVVLEVLEQQHSVGPVDLARMVQEVKCRRAYTPSCWMHRAADSGTGHSRGADRPHLVSP